MEKKNNSVTERLVELAKQILYHKDLYYRGAAIISDEQYDSLEMELRQLDPRHPVLNQVGALQASDGKKEKHAQKMLSLDKCYELNDLLDWANDRPLIGMLKFDGSSCSLVYEKGKLKAAKTRGDGEYGENITLKSLSIDSIPKEILLKQQDASELAEFEVRGEIFCTQQQFKKLSDRMKEMKLTPPTSQRNIVAGLLGRKEHTYLSQYLSFVAFDLLTNKKFGYEYEKLNFLKELNFSIPEFELCKTKVDILNIIAKSKEVMTSGELLIDGLVFTVNDINEQHGLGVTNHHPRYKMAFKFQGETAISKIESISWGVSRNGVCTPVANIQAVNLSGASISRVTLHNYGQVNSFQLKEGDLIEIVRSGEVIPKFLRVVESSEKTKYIIPQMCPSCKNKLLVEDDIWLVCNNEQCPEKNLQSLNYFVSQLNIDDLSDKRLQEMIKQGLVREIPDLFYITKEQFLTLDKTKDVMAEKLFKNIQKAKNDTSLVTFLCALGLSGVSKNKLDKLIDHGYDTVDKFLKLKEADLISIEGFAETSAQAFIKSLHKKKELIEKLMKMGFKITNEKKIYKGSIFYGKKLCITGSLSRKRSEIENDIKSYQGTIVSSVSKETSYLVTNETESTSSKFKNAKKWEISIITENELYQKFLK